MFDCAMAAFMKRKSRIAAVMAAVPTAAQAACRMKSRRLRAENDFFSIESVYARSDRWPISFNRLTLHRIIGRIDDEMNDCSDTVAHLTVSWGCISKIRSDIIHDQGLGRRGQRTAAEQRIERV